MDSTLFGILALGGVAIAFAAVLQFFNLRGPKTPDDERKAERCAPGASLL